MQNFNHAYRAKFIRSTLWIVLAAGIVLADIANGNAAQSETPAAVSASLIAQHSSAQEGLAIGFSSMMLQGQLMASDAIESGAARGCVKIAGGGSGSRKTLSKSGDKTNLQAVVEIYYDDACTKPYLHVVASGEIVSPTVTFDFTETYYSPANKPLGVLDLHLTAKRQNAGAEVQTSIIGTFTPHGANSVPVHIGFTCPLQLGGTSTCTTGIAQKFSSLNLDLAALVPLDTTVTYVINRIFKVTFAGTSAKLARSAADTLSISAPNNRTLQITGPYTLYGNTTTTSGKMARYTLFSPPPVSWTVTNSVRDTVFSIKMGPGTAHNYTGTVKTNSTSNTLATFHLDESGTGWITYSNNVRAKVTAWTLAD